MFDEDSTRRALRTLADEPAPPATTTLDAVLRRGRRRVFMQRAGAAAGVMAVVAVIGVSAVLLRGGTGDDLEIATPPPSPSSQTDDTPWPTGWREVPMPPDMTRSGEHCQDLNASPLPPEPDVGLLPQEQVVQAYNSAIAEVTGEQPVTVSRDWRANSPKHTSPRGYIVNEISIDAVPGNGQLQLEVGQYGGTPSQIADVMVTGYGNCAPPARYVAEDGTVLQLYQADTFTPLQPMQHLQIYRPDNRFYVITSAGFSSEDMREKPDGSSSIVDGRGMLPTSQGELASIGLALVAKLG